MKNFYILSLFLILAWPLSAYTGRQDTVITTNNKKIICENLKIGDTAIMFTYPDYKQVQTITLKNIRTINGQTLDNLYSILITNGNDSTRCKILEESEDEIKYLKEGDTLTYSINKELITMLIKYDGTIKTFDTYKEAKANERKIENERLSAVEQQKSMVLNMDFTEGTVEYSNYGRGELYLDGYHINDKKYQRMCEALNYDIWRQYRRGSGMRTAGTVLTSIGVPLTALSISLFITALYPYHTNGIPESVSYDPVYRTAAAFMAIGAPSMAAGITLYCVGVNQRRRSVKNYNYQNNRQNNDLSLKLGMTNTGNIGFVLDF